MKHFRVHSIYCLCLCIIRNHIILGQIWQRLLYFCTKLHDQYIPVIFLLYLQAHNDLAKTYEAKLAAYGIPVENLGFRPMQNAMTDEQLGEGPAGLVASPM